MNKNTLKITTGAMIIAIFGVLMLINRQTGNIFQDLLIYLFPIPMVAYSAMYGWKSSIPVLAAMGLIAFLFGTLNTMFFAVTEAMIGLIFGSCIYKKMDMTKVLLIVMGCSAVVSLLNQIFLSMLFGYNLEEDILMMQQMMVTVFTQRGIAFPEQMVTTNFLFRMLIVGMILTGLLQGFIIYTISLLLLRRLRFQFPKPKSVFLYNPPQNTAYASLLLFFFYNITFSRPLDNEFMQAAIQTSGLLGYFYLIIFGFIALLLYFRIKVPRLGRLSGLVGFLLMMIFPQFMMIGGFFYLTTRLHNDMLAAYEKIYGKLE